MTKKKENAVATKTEKTDKAPKTMKPAAARKAALAAVPSGHTEQFTLEKTDRETIKVLHDQLVKLSREMPEDAVARVCSSLSPEDKEHCIEVLLKKEAREAGLFVKKERNINELSPDYIKGGYPYRNRYPAGLYEKELFKLQVELLKMQEWVKANGKKIIVIFEGRDAAGKGGTIRRFVENLNPRGARTVALPKPTEAEAGQWYFQRYAAQLPNPGEICFFDRSWYNRAVVEPVMGFCTQEQTEQFLKEVPSFERGLVHGDTILVKFWLAISQEEQTKRFNERRTNPLKRWKLSPVDVASMSKWDEYSVAIERMFRASDMTETPWTVIRNEDKRRGRLNAIRVLLQSVDYEGRDFDNIGEIDPMIVGRAGILMPHMSGAAFSSTMAATFRRDHERAEAAKNQRTEDKADGE